MKFKFEKLIIWQKAMEYGENINKLSYRFPKDESRKSEDGSKNFGLRTTDFGLINYISNEEFNEHYEYAFNLMNMMVAFKEKIR